MWKWHYDNQPVSRSQWLATEKDRTDFEEPFMPSFLALCINQKIVKNQSELDVNSFVFFFWCDLDST